MSSNLWLAGRGTNTAIAIGSQLRCFVMSNPVMVLLQVPSIQQTAALALGRLANYSDDLAEAVVAHEILPQLVYSLGEQNVRQRVIEALLMEQSTTVQTS